MRSVCTLETALCVLLHIRNVHDPARRAAVRALIHHTIKEIRNHGNSSYQMASQRRQLAQH